MLSPAVRLLLRYALGFYRFVALRVLSLRRCENWNCLSDFRSCLWKFLSFALDSVRDLENVDSWIHQRWIEKERDLERWEESGQFDAEPMEMPLPPSWPLVVAALASVAWAVVLGWLLWSRTCLLLALLLDVEAPS